MAAELDMVVTYVMLPRGHVANQNFSVLPP